MKHIHHNPQLTIGGEKPLYNTKINPNKTDDGLAKGRLKILRKERKISKQIPNSVSTIAELGLPMDSGLFYYHLHQRPSALFWQHSE